MKRMETGVPGAVVLEPRVFGDERGFFYESWNRERFAELGLDFEVTQSNVSASSKGVLRGLHYQWPEPQGKLVSVLEGEVYDVAVDIRRGSPSHGRWAAAVLSSENRRHFWIPEGFAHGFLVLSERAVFTYLCTRPYRPEFDRAVRWNDARLAIDWPEAQPQLSGKDGRAPFRDDIADQDLPIWETER